MGVLDSRSVIVAGSGRGIGRATADLLASGAKALVNAHDGDLAEHDQLLNIIGGPLAGMTR